MHSAAPSDTSPQARARRRGAFSCSPAKGCDRQRRYYPIGRVNDDGMHHDARTAVEPEKSHPAERQEYEKQGRNRREEIKKPHGVVMTLHRSEDKSERDSPKTAPDERPVYVWRRERYRRLDAERRAYSD